MKLKFFLYFFSFFNFILYAENTVTVSPRQKNILFYKQIFGSNLLGYDPKTFEKNYFYDDFTYSDFGAGVWDPGINMSVAKVIYYIQNAGISSLRFPGGCGTHGYDWKKSIGKERKHFLFGIDEFLKVCNEVKAEPVITISYFTGDVQDAADLVQYLNSSADESHPWAMKRAENGHHSPYKVKYFEIGNEIYHGNHRDIKKIEPEEYGQRFLKFYSALKKVDPFAKVGLVLYDDYWNSKLAETVRESVDFLIIHTYPSPYWGEKLVTTPPNEIFKLALASPAIKENYNYKKTIELFRKKSGKVLPIAVTEYNGGYAQDVPIAYRFTLGCALSNAELLRIFMFPENNIIMANNWNFCNEYWGMIANRFKGNLNELHKPYYKRPNYYVLDMYHNHFGDILIEADVKCDYYDITGSDWYKRMLANDFNGVVSGRNLLSDRWNIIKVSKVLVREENKKIRNNSSGKGNDSRQTELEESDTSCLKITFTNPWKKNYYHTFKTAIVEPNSFYKLSGFIKTENIVSENGIGLEVQDGRGWAATKTLSGTQNWTYVETFYHSLHDPKGVKIIARNVGTYKPIMGTVWFRDVRLEKFIPVVDGKIPYLSVNASKSEDGKRIYLMVINKNMETPVSAIIRVKDFIPASTGYEWTLNGPEIISTNDQNHDNVKITPNTIQITGKKFNCTFEAHSLTAIEIHER